MSTHIAAVARTAHSILGLITHISRTYTRIYPKSLVSRIESNKILRFLHDMAFWCFVDVLLFADLLPGTLKLVIY